MAKPERAFPNGPDWELDHHSSAEESWVIEIIGRTFHVTRRNGGGWYGEMCAHEIPVDTYNMPNPDFETSGRRSSKSAALTWVRWRIAKMRDELNSIMRVR